MNKRWPLFGIAFIMVAMTLVTANLNWNSKWSSSIVEADAKGYYAYLPAIFIYHDLNFGFVDSLEGKKYFDPTFFYDYRIGAHGQTVNKYYSGTALLQLPFFLATHAYCKLGGAPPDGYSEPYRYMVTVATLFYLLLGLLAFNCLMVLLGANAFSRTVVLVAMVFGTNLFYYAAVEPGMSHVYSFAAVAAFALFAKRYFAFQNGRYLIASGLLLGIVVLIRPVNGLVVLALPFLACSGSAFWEGLIGLGKKVRAFAAALGGMAAVIAIQLVIYRISTGHFLVYSYGGERLDLLQPHVWDILFSYRKGLFLYTPFHLLSVACVGVLFWRKQWWMGSWYVVFFVGISYVLSSWWNWWYGGSFSGRVFVEFLPILVLPMATALGLLRQTGAKVVAVSLLMALVALCQFQTYQYRYYLIHWENMTKEKYWEVFLKMNP